jgi:tetratricopeptide (TPR) repeat protein
VQTLTPPSRIINLPATANIAIVAALNGDYFSDIEQSFDSLTITNIAMAIKSNMEKSPKYNSYIFPVYTINTVNGLSDENISDIKENSNANYLISVEKFQSSVNKQRILTSRDNCVRIITPHYSVIKIYDIDKNTVIDERSINDTLTLQVNVYPGETENDVSERLPDDKTAVLMVIKEMAKAYVEEIVPFWREETRFYYIADNIAKAEIYVDNEKWTEAMNVWMRHVNDENQELAAISCFNMALGCEMLGEYELALKWMENVKKKNANYFWNEYKKLLEKRIEEKTILDKIMN